MDTGTIAEAITKAVARDGPDPDENMRLAFELCVRPLLLCPFTHCMAPARRRLALAPSTPPCCPCLSVRALALGRRKARKAGMPESMIERVLEMASGGATGDSAPVTQQSPPAPPSSSGQVQPVSPAPAPAAFSMNDVMEGIKQAVESGGADPASNMRLQFVMQKARESGVEDAMLERVLGMVAASAAPAPAPLGSAPVARPAGGPVDDEDEEPELTEEDLAAMRQDVLDSIVESVQRSGRDLSQNLKLGFMLKRASGMGIPDSEIEEAVGGPIPTAGASPSSSAAAAAAAPSKPPPVASSGGGSGAGVVEDSAAATLPRLPSSVEHVDPPEMVPQIRATDVVVGALMPAKSQEELVEMSSYQRNTYANSQPRKCLSDDVDNLGCFAASILIDSPQHR